MKCLSLWQPRKSLHDCGNPDNRCDRCRETDRLLGRVDSRTPAVDDKRKVDQ